MSNALMGVFACLLSMAGLWRDLLTPRQVDRRVLFIGDSGEIEAALVACFPAAVHEGWGPPFAPLEGARIEFGGEPAHFRDVEILRVATDTHTD